MNSESRISGLGVVAVAAAAAAMLSLGCGVTKPSNDEIGKSKQSALHIVVGPTTGVTGIRFLITQIDCKTLAPGEVVVDETKSLDELSIPDSIPELGDHPLDSGSMHAFADDFELLLPGCYHVSTQPYDDKEPSCHEAHKDVVVDAGKTTEVFLINQCQGPTPGALDVISALNHPPVLTDVAFDKSKFVRSCNDQVICATAYDPENDPLKFVWTVTGGPTVSGPFDVTSTTNPDGSITQCVRYIPRAPGKVTLDVTVYDLLHNNSAMSTPETFEQWLADEGYPSASHTTLDFFFYAESAASPTGTEICDDKIDNDCDGDIDGADKDCVMVGECPPGQVHICGGALDLFLLEDLTGSFSDDLAKVNGFSGTLANDLLVANAGTKFGVASFKDKPRGGFGGSTDYVYKLEQALTSTPASFVSAIAGLAAGGGSDTPEAQIEALNLLAQDSAAGFRMSFPHFVVLATDAPPHVAPQCVSAGFCSMPNNNDGVADPTEDYPSITQLVTTLNAQGVTPIFAVTAGNESFYQSIVDELGRGSVVTLASDSSNLETAIFSGLPCHCEAK